MLITQEELLKQKREAEARAKLALKEGLDNDGIPRPPVKSKFVSIYYDPKFSATL